MKKIKTGNGIWRYQTVAEQIIEELDKRKEKWREQNAEKIQDQEYRYGEQRGKTIK